MKQFKTILLITLLLTTLIGFSQKIENPPNTNLLPPSGGDCCTMTICSDWYDHPSGDGQRCKTCHTASTGIPGGGGTVTITYCYGPASTPDQSSQSIEPKKVNSISSLIQKDSKLITTVSNKQDGHKKAIKPKGLYILTEKEYKLWQDGKFDVKAVKKNEINNPIHKEKLSLQKPSPEDCPNECCIHYYEHLKCWYCVIPGGGGYIFFEYCEDCVGCGFEQT